MTDAQPYAQHNSVRFGLKSPVVLMATACVVCFVGAIAYNSYLWYMSPLVAAARGDTEALLSWMRKHGASGRYRDWVTGIQETPLHAAVRSGKHDVVRSLLKNGADAFAIDSLGVSPLMLSVRTFDDSARADDIKQMVDIFTDAGVDLSHRHGPNGMTALHYAASTHYRASVEILLRVGVAPNINDDRNRSPLHYSVMGAYFDSMDGATAVLLSFGADIHHSDMEGVTPLDIARQIGRSDALLHLQSHAGGVTP